MNERRPMVLVVDDDPDILDIVGIVLELQGVPSTGASDGIAALTALRSSSEIGLVLLDLMMPRMSGHELLAEMKREPALAEVPVVVISGGYQTEQDVRRMGAEECLPKPVDATELMRVVARFVPVPQHH
jgi:CheY-like chemotaxis protein